MNCHHKLNNVLERARVYLHGFMQKQKLTLGWNLSKSFSHLRSLKIWNVKMCMQNQDWQIADIHNTRTATASHLCIYNTRGCKLIYQNSIQKWN